MKGLVAYIDFAMQSQFLYNLSFPIFNIIDYKVYEPQSFLSEENLIILP